MTYDKARECRYNYTCVCVCKLQHWQATHVEGKPDQNTMWRVSRTAGRMSRRSGKEDASTHCFRKSASSNLCRTQFKGRDVKGSYRDVTSDSWLKLSTNFAFFLNRSESTLTLKWCGERLPAPAPFQRWIFEKLTMTNNSETSQSNNFSFEMPIIISLKLDCWRMPSRPVSCVLRIN